MPAQEVCFPRTRWQAVEGRVNPGGQLRSGEALRRGWTSRAPGHAVAGDVALESQPVSPIPNLIAASVSNRAFQVGLEIWRPSKVRTPVQNAREDIRHRVGRIVGVSEHASGDRGEATVLFAPRQGHVGERGVGLHGAPPRLPLWPPEPPTTPQEHPLRTR